MGLLGWLRSRLPRPGVVRVPPGHKVVVVSPSQHPLFTKLESGLCFADFGQAADYQQLFDAVERALRLVPKTSIVWSIQKEPIVAWTSDEVLLANWLRRFHDVRQLRGTEAEAGDVAVVPDFGSQGKAMMILLASLGVGVHLPGPEGESLIEVHRPDGIVIGMPGPAFQGGKRTILRDMYSTPAESGDASDSERRVQEIRAHEQEFIRAVLRNSRPEEA
jgi:hypothetical protein